MARKQPKVRKPSPKPITIDDVRTAVMEALQDHAINTPHATPQPVDEDPMADIPEFLRHPVQPADRDPVVVPETAPNEPPPTPWLLVLAMTVLAIALGTSWVWFPAALAWAKDFARPASADLEVLNFGAPSKATATIPEGYTISCHQKWSCSHETGVGIQCVCPLDPTDEN